MGICGSGARLRAAKNWIFCDPVGAETGFRFRAAFRPRAGIYYCIRLAAVGMFGVSAAVFVAGGSLGFFEESAFLAPCALRREDYP